MSKASFTGTLIARKVTIGVKAYNMVGNPGDLPEFRTLHRECLKPIKQLSRCPSCDKILEKEEQVSGFPIRHEGEQIVPIPGPPVPAEKQAEGYILVSDEDRATLVPDPEDGRPITVQAIVPRGGLNHLWQDKAYYLTPEEAVDRHVYSAFMRALRDEKAWAVVTYVSHRASHMGVVLPTPSGLALATLYFPEYIRTMGDIGQEVKEEKVSGEVAKLFRAVIQDMMKKPAIDPEDLHDESRERLRALIEAKIKNRPWVPAELPTSPDKTVDILLALRNSLPRKYASKPKR